MSFMPRASRRLAVGITVLAAGVLALPATGSTKQQIALPSAADVHIEAGLASRLAGGPGMVALAYDDSQISQEALNDYLERHGLEGHAFDATNVGVACLGSAAELGTLAAAPGILAISGDRAVETALDTSVPTTFNGPPSAIYSGLGITGRGVGLAVVDTGIDGRHKDVEHLRRVKRNVRLLFSHREAGVAEFICKDIFTDRYEDTQFPPLEDTEVASGHGTHITSVAAGDGSTFVSKYRGVAWQADIMGVAIGDAVTPEVDVIDPTNNQRIVKLSLVGIIAGLAYVIEQGTETEDGDVMRVKAILGGWKVDGLFDPWHPLNWELQNAKEWNIAIVVPAGNEGPQVSDCSAAATCRISGLSASPNVITVAAGPKSSRDALAGFSSRGDPVPRTYGDYGAVRYEPEITAPGTSVIAARRVGTASTPLDLPYAQSAAQADKQTKIKADYVPLTGTSVAAAHVAGVIVLMQEAAVRAKGCYLSYQQVRDILAQTATPIPGYGPHEVGAGMVDATAAVNTARFAPIDVVQTVKYNCPGLGNT